MHDENLLSRCAHGVYDPDGRGRAWHCGLCRTQSYELAKPPKDRKFILPSLRPNHFPPANVTPNPDACPKCGSYIRYEVKPGDSRHAECAECNTLYTRKHGIK